MFRVRPQQQQQSDGNEPVLRPRKISSFNKRARRVEEKKT